MKTPAEFKCIKGESINVNTVNIAKVTNVQHKSGVCLVNEKTTEKFTNQGEEKKKSHSEDEYSVVSNWLPATFRIGGVLLSQKIDAN